jgi:hypothetical protein
MGFLVIGVMFFVVISMLMSRAGVDWWITIVTAIVPIGVVTFFTHFFVNGKSPSYAIDLFLWQSFRLQEWIYLCGAITIPPQLWKKGELPRHPNQF